MLFRSLESVPVEIDEVQRRLTQLELAARQLAEETEEHAQQRLAEIEEESTELRLELANLREQWESEKLSAGDVHHVRERQQQVAHQYEQLATTIKEKQSAGEQVGEDLYQSLYELDSEKKKLDAQLSEQELSVEQEQQVAANNGNGNEKTPERRRLLRQEVGPDEIAEVVSAWTGVPLTRMMETERAKLLVQIGRAHV